MSSQIGLREVQTGILLAMNYEFDWSRFGVSRPPIKIKIVARPSRHGRVKGPSPHDSTRRLFRGIGVAKRTGVTTKVPLLLISLLLALGEGFVSAWATKIPRVGYLGLEDPSSSFFKSFRQGLRELGYIENQSITVEPRFAYGNDWRLNGLAFELVRFPVDVIVAQSPSDLRAAMNATETIPVVMTYHGDPVAARIIASRKRPGGNVTGIAGLPAGLGGKWLELLKEAVPGVKRVGVLYTRFSERESPMMNELEGAARRIGVKLQLGEVGIRYIRGAYTKVGAAFTWATREQADALIVLPASPFDQNPEYIADLARDRRLPAIFSRARFAEAGGLMSYGANGIEQFRRAAYVVDRILKGAKPAVLPVELPTKFELVVNLKTAKEIGVSIRPEVLMWADRVIK